MRRFIGPVLLSCLLGTPAFAQQAQNPPTLRSYFTAERLGTAVFSQLMLSARAFADIRYQTLQVDLSGGRVSIIGLEVSPNLPGRAPGACVIRAQRATIGGAPFDQIDLMRVRVTLDNALVDFDCLPPDARPVVGMLGVTDIAVDRLDMTVNYDLPQGSATVQFQAGIDGLVRLIGDADIDYISYRMNMTTETPEPSVLLRRARVQIEDRGLAAQAQRILPAELREPGTAAALVEQNLTGMLGRGGPLNPAQQQLITDAGQMAATLAQGGTRIVLETGITDPPLRIDAALVNDPGALIAALAPRVTNNSVSLRQSVARDMLIAAKDNDLAPEDRLPVGRALITGVGAPRDRALAVDILAPLAKDGNAEAALLLAQAFAQSDPGQAYSHALTAVAAGRAEGLALLDRLEDRLRFEQVINVQGASAPPALRDPDRFSTLADMRSAALAHTTGIGAPRSYETAYFWASMAAAGGDSAAASLRDDLDARMRLRGLSSVWEERTAKIERDVLSGWIDADLAARLQTP